MTTVMFSSALRFHPGRRLARPTQLTTDRYDRVNQEDSRNYSQLVVRVYPPNQINGSGHLGGKFNYEWSDLLGGE